MKNTKKYTITFTSSQSFCEVMTALSLVAEESQDFHIDSENVKVAKPPVERRAKTQRQTPKAVTPRDDRRITLDKNGKINIQATLRNMSTTEERIMNTVWLRKSAEYSLKRAIMFRDRPVSRFPTRLVAAE